MVKNLSIATGRRKTSVARVFLRKGKGEITINKEKIEDYFPLAWHQIIVKQPLQITDNLTNYDLLVSVKGGGVSSQAGAIRHGIARVLVKADSSNTASLKSNGLLTRDPRMVERKKYGRRGARRRFQFSKR
ncbi:MAG: 30S ribosomal protein S9 [Spirochaetales bacterium]|nr:30S ribosomal protein S9 [Spirochaetales bacterium]